MSRLTGYKIGDTCPHCEGGMVHRKDCPVIAEEEAVKLLKQHLFRGPDLLPGLKDALGIASRFADREMSAAEIRDCIKAQIAALEEK